MFPLLYSMIIGWSECFAIKSVTCCINNMEFIALPYWLTC